MRFKNINGSSGKGGIKVLIGMVFALGILFATRNPIGAADSTGTLRLTVAIAPFAPAGISNLTALTSSSSEILLQWTAPGDAEGRQPLFPGSLYRIRYSSVSVIRSADFDAPPSTMAVSSIDISTGTVPVGEPQSRTITGLLSGTTYHFAIKTMGIFSLFSVWNSSLDAAGVNVRASTTTLPDTTAPNAISNLTALAGALDGDVLLSWSVPGDDGTVGTLPAGSLYRIRRSTNPITNFALAPSPFFETAVSTSAIPPTTNASLTLTGLNPGTSYFFAIVTRDEGGNESSWSTGVFVNMASSASAQDLALSAPSGLSVLSTFVSSVTLAWTNPAAPASIDDRSLYRVYQATYNFAGITDANVSLATSANHPSASISVTGLAQGGNFFFRVSAVDQGNQGGGLFSLALESAVSASTQTRTITTTPPAGVSNLTALAASQSSVLLQWTAPGDAEGAQPLPAGSLYRIRYSSVSVIRAADFDAPPSTMAVLTQDISTGPVAIGAAQSTTIAGLLGETTYFFALKTRGAAGIFSVWNSSLDAVSVNTAASTSTLNIPPNGISNLTALAGTLDGDVLLGWSVPGDDGTVGTLPVGSLYRIRRSTNPITNFALAPSPFFETVVSTSAIAPQTDVSLTLTGLNPGTSYFFAIVTRDENASESSWSTGAFVNTANNSPAQDLPLSAPSGLSVLSTFVSSVTLTWTNPPAPASIDDRSLYRVYRATYNFAAITDSNVSLATSANHPSASISVTGLAEGGNFFFRVSAVDQGNQGFGLFSLALESAVSASTQTRTITTTPPAGVSNLTALTATSFSILLQWSAPGDVENTQPLPAGSLYRIKYSSVSVIRAADFDSPPSTMAVLTQDISTGPVTIGDPQSTTIAGLLIDTAYFFALKTRGASGLFSVWNSSLDAAGVNVAASTRTSNVETFAPSAITNLSALTGAVEGEIQLTWNAPGDDGTVGTASLYIVRRATWAALAGDATGWWNHTSLATIAAPPAPLVSGSAQSMTVAGLAPGATYYFGIRAEDDQGNISDFDMGVSTPALQARSMPQSDVTAPATVSDLNILSVSTTTATIRWTTPGDDGTTTSPLDAAGRAEEVTIKWSTFSMTLADFLAIGASSTSVRVASSSGTIETVVITGLQQATPYFFVLRYRDEVPNFSGLSNQPSQSTHDNLPPSPPLFFTATPRPDLGNAIALSWTNPPEPDFTGIRILARTDVFPTGPADPAARLVATTAKDQIAALDTELIGGATYYYGAFSFDAGFFFSSASTASAISPQALDIVKPLEPRGLDSSRASDGSSFTLTWLPVEKNVDGSAANDLISYRVYRSTPFFEPKTLFATLPSTLTAFTDGTIAGETFHYYVTALDFSGNESTRSVVMDSSAEMLMFVLAPDNSGTMLQIPKIMREGMKKENNTFGDDLWITVERLLDEEIGRRLRVYRFKTLKFKSSQEAAGFIFPSKDVLAMISYADAVKGGVILGGAPSMASQVNLPIADAPNQLALFWFNGNEYIKIGGDVDTASRFVSIKTNRAGKFALVQSLKATEFTLGTIYPRIFSPNGDGWNDVATFVFENPKDSGVQGKIFDIGGGFVANMTPGGLPDTLRWDGKDSSGKVVSAGIYLYQIKAEGKNLTGTVVVAR